MTSSSLIDLPLLDLPDECLRQLGSLILGMGANKIDLPLSSVDINAKVIERVAQVTVKQVFQNNTADHMEAVYIFPLAAGSAISSFNMKVGDRVIKGVVEERAEARRQYQQAVDDGKRAAIMEQERDDVFTVQVGNLPPGEQVTIEISYAERLPFFEDGSCELRLPLVVAPRYIPGHELNRDSVGDGIVADTNLVPDASRITPPRLAPGVDAGTALTLKVELLLDEDSKIENLACSQHSTKTSLSSGEITVSLARTNERLNRDFVLRWQNASDDVKTSLVTYTAEDGQTYGLLSVMPPRRVGYLGAARDIIFVLDKSGSMEGIKMTSAVRACSILLNTLGPRDRFTIVAFDQRVEWMPGNRTTFINADIAGIEKGEKFLRGISAQGGTEMDYALSNAFIAIAARAEKEGRMPSLVVLTDGEVGNESQIMQRVQTQIGDARLFVVGIDTAVNSGLLKRLANLGGGSAAFVEPGVQLEEALTAIGREIGAPLVTDIQVEDGDLSIDRSSISPSRIPDIFAGRASVSFLKLSGNKGKICVKGIRSDSKPFEIKVKAHKAEMPCIAQLWAKTHIVDFEDDYRVNPAARESLKAQIVELAVKHSLLTKFTAFVVVDESEVVNKTGDSRKIVQPAEMPESWAEEQVSTQGWASSTGSYGMAPQAPAAFQAQRAAAPSPAPPNMPMNMLGASPMAQPAPPNNSPPVAWGDENDTFGSSAGFGGSINDKLAEIFNENEANAFEESTGQEADLCVTGAFFEEPAQQIFQDCDQVTSAPASIQKSELGLDAQNKPGSQSCKDSANNQPEVRARMMQKKQMPAAPIPVSQPTPPQPPMPPKAPPTPPGLQRLNAAPSAGKDSGEAAAIQKEKSAKARSESSSVKANFDAFISEFEAAFEMLAQEKIPDADNLEAVRMKLLRALALLKIGMDLPLLQRFLRSSSIEMIASLRDSSLSASDHRTFWNTKLSQFKQLKQEFDSAGSGQEQSFWDSSI